MTSGSTSTPAPRVKIVSRNFTAATAFRSVHREHRTPPGFCKQGLAGYLWKPIGRILVLRGDPYQDGYERQQRIGRLWLNGELIASNTAVNWSGGNSTARQGWTRFLIGSNQKSPSNGRPMYVDFDDFYVTNTRPSNRDAHGNYFIGPIGSGSNPPTEPQQPPTEPQQPPPSPRTHLLRPR